VTVRVRVYSAAGCHLCDVAKELLERERPALGFELEVIDITGDAELEAAHREEIPVVFVAGRKAFKYHVDPVELRRRVRAAGTGAAAKG
jgi:glutaredoxin